MKRRCKSCRAYLGAHTPEEESNCGPCRLGAWTPERIIWEDDHPHGDEFVGEDESVVRELKANEVRSALPARMCECERPVRMEDDLGARCLTCGAWMLELAA